MADRRPNAAGIAWQVDQEQEQLSEALPGWQCWPIDTWERRRVWSAMPHGARVAVIEGKGSPAELIEAVREYAADLPARITDAKELQAMLPETGIGRDRAEVLGALIVALEALAAADS